MNYYTLLRSFSHFFKYGPWADFFKHWEKTEIKKLAICLFLVKYLYYVIEKSISVGKNAVDESYLEVKMKKDSYLIKGELHYFGSTTI